MNTECVRIADQLRRAFHGEAWHGPPLSSALEGLNAQQALARPLPSAHSIWELVLHIEIYAEIANQAISGTPMPRLYDTGKDWIDAASGESEWTRTKAQVLACGERLAASIERFDDSRLPDTVPGREYNFYFLFHGVVQHSLYHCGQIAMLKRAVVASH